MLIDNSRVLVVGVFSAVVRLIVLVETQFLSFSVGLGWLNSRFLFGFLKLV